MMQPFPALSHPAWQQAGWRMVGPAQNKPGYSFGDLRKSWYGRPSYSHTSCVCAVDAAHQESNGEWQSKTECADEATK